MDIHSEDDLKKRAADVNQAAFWAAMDKVPDVAPDVDDTL